MGTSEIYSVLLALLFAVAAGLVGSYALMKRMLLASDVISHVALPGLGLAFLLHFNPLLGGGATLLIGTLLIWQLQKRTGLPTDAMIGVIFAASLALGAILTPKEDLIDALFGEFPVLSLPVFIAGLSAILAIILFVWRFRYELVLNLFSPELAASTGVNLERLNLYFLLIFSLTVLVGLRTMGALLAGALIIVPAATGRRFADSLPRFLIASCAASLVAVAGGLSLSAYLFRGHNVGPTIVIVAAALFALTLLRRPK